MEAGAPAKDRTKVDCWPHDERLASRVMFERLHALRSRLTLSQRFAATGGVVMLLTMVTIGLWVTHTIRDNVIANSAQATALYMDSFIAPLAQELAQSDTLSIGPSQAIEEMLAGSEMGKRIAAIKIWKVGGLVAYSDEAGIVGKRFEPSGSLGSAFAGQVAAELDDLSSDENSLERGKGPLLEIYSPLRQAYSGEILGAMEIYETATDLEAALNRTLLQTWAVVAAVTLAVFAALFGIVHAASGLIDRQAAALRARIADTERISEQNRSLRHRVERASRRVAEVNEHTLRRISAELHDGPKQLLGLAGLRLGAVAARSAKADDHDLRIVSDALGEAMRAIGTLSSNLATPQVEGLSVSDIICQAAKTHTFRTETQVALDLDETPAEVPEAIRICVHRFLQETLNNAFWHAGGAGQRITCRHHGGELIVTVANGPGEPAKTADAAPGGLGLSGLRDRVESLGGKFSFRRTGDGGAEARMHIDLGTKGRQDG